MLVLPAEIIDHIFNFLQEDIRSLKACSKAHPLYSRCAERYLYADIEVRVNHVSAVSKLYKQISNKPHILAYTRTLEFCCRGFFATFNDSVVLSMIVTMVLPRMVNLVSLKLTEESCSDDGYNDLLSAFETCLQQSAIEEICLEGFSDFPLSILDNGKHIKKLTLSDCTAGMEESISNTKSLGTLVIVGKHNLNLVFWTTCRATSLTTLHWQLRGRVLRLLDRAADGVLKFSDKVGP